MHEIYPYRFDAAAIISRFGGPAATARSLASVGCQAGPKTVQKWGTREYIPSDAVACLMVYASRNGDEFDIKEYILTEQEA